MVRWEINKWKNQVSPRQSLDIVKRLELFGNHWIGYIKSLEQDLYMSEIPFEKFKEQSNIKNLDKAIEDELDKWEALDG